MGSSNVATHAFIELLVLLMGLSGCILLQISNVQPQPYMDEIFHVPQAKKYCKGKFDEWDPMITTLPGLYWISSTVIRLAAGLSGQLVATLCTTFWLRCVNIAFTLGNFILLRKIIQKISQESKNVEDGQGLLTAFCLTTFPVLYFFTFLFYTDCGSVFFTLLVYMLSLHKRHITAACFGVVAILFRQTNIVWVAFSAAVIVEEELIEWIQPGKKDIPEEVLTKGEFLQLVCKQLWIADMKSRINLIWCIFKKAWAYCLVGVGFAMFVVINGGVVVGAKDDHQMVLHFPQIFYLTAFMAIFSFMHLISLSRFKNCICSIIQNKILVVVLCIVSGLLIWKFTFAHRYLLSDNRHYTFYLWGRVFQRHYLIKYMLIPAYICAMWCMWDVLGHKSILWKCAYGFCISINLIPSPLLEFRYFIVPYLIYRLNMPLATYCKLSLELFLYSCINVATLYVFLKKEFYWPDTEDVQRFMW